MYKTQYSNPSDLGAVDIATIAAFQSTIDFAAYALDDPRIVSALAARAAAGVKIRLYIDRNELLAAISKTGSLASSHLQPLLNQGNVQIRVKASTVLMHLKSYCGDNAIVRDGSCNFSLSGEELQDNSLTLSDDPAAVTAFSAKFNAMWSRPDNLAPSAVAQQTPHAAFHASRHQH